MLITLYKEILAFKENIMWQDFDCVNIEGLIGNPYKI